MAAGMHSTSRYLGSIIGSAVLAGAVGTTGDSQSGLEAMLWLVAIAGIVATFAGLGLRGRGHVRE